MFIVFDIFFFHVKVILTENKYETHNFNSLAIVENF